ncbi:MAG: hypothetical protein WKG01_17030 [Kofleriaceae bacterium]
MKLIKLLILGFGLLGIVGFAIPLENLTAGFETNLLWTVLILAGFAVPVLVGLISMSKQWQVWMGALALVGFGFVAVKTKVWDGFSKFGESSLGGKLMLIAILGGVAVSIFSLTKREENW